MTGIYKITSPEGLVYIGQSIYVPKRILHHMYGKGMPKKLDESYKKHGFKNHKLEFIFECDAKDLNMYEHYFISKYDSANNGLNKNNIYHELTTAEPVEISILLGIKTKTIYKIIITDN